MAKVTSKLQITLPKRLAEEFRIEPGDEIEFVPAGDSIRIVPARSRVGAVLSPAERLRLFDAATARQREREKGRPFKAKASTDRGWKREDLYMRGKPR